MLFYSNHTTLHCVTSAVNRYTEEPRNSAFQGTCGFYALLRERPYRQYIELNEKTSSDLEFMLLYVDFPYRRMPYCGVHLYV